MNKLPAKHIALPGAACWELWSQQDGKVSFIREIPDPEQLAQEDLWLLALPVRQVLAVPLWLNATEDSLLSSLISLQLERRGLLPRLTEKLVSYCDVIAQEGSQRLVLVTVLAENLPKALEISQVKNYEVSARLWPLPPQEITLWRENGRLAVALKREDKLCYFQSLGQDDLNLAAVQELLCLKLQLEAQKIISYVNGITLWGDFSDQSIILLRQTFKLPVQKLSMPLPLSPSHEGRLTPYAVRQSQELDQNKTKKRQAVLALVALYGIFVLSWIGLLVGEHVEKHWFEHQLEANAVTVAKISQTAARWNDLQPAINPEYYPVELLYRSATTLPSEGVRLTLFEQRGSKILMTGEAKSSRSAFKFKEDLEKRKDLAMHHWQMPQPKPLPNDSAQFQIEGNSHASTY